MDFKRNLFLSVEKETAVYIDISFTENGDEPDAFQVIVRRKPGGVIEGEATWHVTESSGSFSLQITTQTVGAGICLAGCLAGIVSSSGPLVDCLKKARKHSEVRECFDRNAVAQVVGSLSCIYGCLSL